MQKFNLSRDEAEKRFKRIKPLIDRVVKKGKPSRSWLLRWVFDTNWKATFLWSFLKHKIIWVGKGYNPDYTRGCNFGTCTVDSSGCTKAGLPCLAPADCTGGSCVVTGSCGCPSPLPNSTQTTGCSITCLSTGICRVCNLELLTCTPTCGRSNCAAGLCSYTCDVGYHWSGVACVPDVVPKAGLHPSKPLAIILNE
jgi:hypothetical protein